MREESLKSEIFSHLFRIISKSITQTHLKLKKKIVTMLKRSMVFIDAGNLLHGWSELCSRREKRLIDYKKFIVVLADHTDFIRGYYYDSTTKEQQSPKQRYYDMLRQHTITIVTKPLKFKRIVCRHCNHAESNVPHQKGVDVAMATDMMGLCFEDAYDVAIVVSGDNDFEEAIKYIKSRGKNVWIVSCVSCLGQDLMRVGDRVIKIDDIYDRIAKPTKNI